MVWTRRTTKSWLMNFRTLVNRLVILTFMGLVGYSLAKAIQFKSIIGILLALVSLGAGIYFVYLLIAIRKEQQKAA